VHFLADARKGATLKIPAQRECTLTAYFVKYYLCMAAAGTVAAPIYICADENMKEGVIDVHECQCITAYPTNPATVNTHP
jgi:hypothetical protein